MLAKQLAEAITVSTKWLMFSSPSNQKGVKYLLHELQALAKVLLAHQHVYIQTDYLFEHFIYEGRTFHFLAKGETALYNRTVACNGISKGSSMIGWRVGFPGRPKDIIANMSKMQSQSTSGSSAVSQAAAVAALTGLQQFVVKRTANLQRRRDILFDRLNKCDGLKCDLLGGARYIFCSCARNISRKAPNDKFIETEEDFTTYPLNSVGVAVLQGNSYGL